MAGGYPDGISARGNEDTEFRELVVRWVQFSVFIPIMRLHGMRHCKAPLPGFKTCPNEPWSYGDVAYGHLDKAIRAREALRPYVNEVLLQVTRSHTYYLLLTTYYLVLQAT